MDKFTLSIDKRKFQSTNATWNALMLNDPWSVGYVSDLIERKPFQNKEDWEKHYYESGTARQALLLKLPSNDKKLLNNFLLKKENPSLFKKIPHQLKRLNTGYGRTREDLTAKAQVLKEKMNTRLSLDECFECVRFRTICETWNGIKIREKEAIEKLKALFPMIHFQKTDGEIDYQFGVDYELFLNEKLLGGIQIKPKSYLGNAAYIQKAKQANARKHAEYTHKTGTNVRVVVADLNGNILNDDDFLQRLGSYYRRHVLNLKNRRLHRITDERPD